MQVQQCSRANQFATNLQANRAFADFFIVPLTAAMVWFLPMEPEGIAIHRCS